MTDDEILLLARESGINYAYDSEGEWSGLTDDVITNRYTHKPAPEDDFTIKHTVEILKPFVRAIEQRTLTNQKAKWYQEGVEAERDACAKLCEESRTKYVDRTISEPRTIDPEVARVAMMTCEFIAHDIRQRGE